MTLERSSVLSDPWFFICTDGTDYMLYGIHHTPGSYRELCRARASLSSGVATATISLMTQGFWFYVSFLYWNGNIWLNSSIDFYTMNTLIITSPIKKQQITTSTPKLHLAVTNPKANHYSDFCFCSLRGIIQSILFCVWLNTELVRFDLTVVSSL